MSIKGCIGKHLSYAVQIHHLQFGLEYAIMKLKIKKVWLEVKNLIRHMNMLMAVYQVKQRA
jgi:hypothetical protein